MTIKKRLILFVGVNGFLLICGIVIIFISINIIQYIYQSYLDDIDFIRETQVGFKRQVQEWKNTLIRGQNKTDYYHYWTACVTESDTVLVKLKTLRSRFVEQKRDVSRIDNLISEMESLITEYDAALAGYEWGNPQTIFTVDAAVRGIDRAPEAEIDTLVEDVKREITRDIRKLKRLIVIITASGLAFAIGLFLLFSMIMAKSILTPINTINKKMKSLAAKEADLTQEISISGNNEISHLSSEVNSFLHSLSTLVNHIKESSQRGNKLSVELSGETEEISSVITNITQAVHEIRSNIEQLDSELHHLTLVQEEVMQLHDREVTLIEEQTSFVSEASASIEEMVASVNSIANLSREKTTLLETISRNADIAEKDLEEIIAAVHMINDSTGQINDMIAVIKNISTQTNLLAMNAAIEAAHAGESGLGFSVVADEVRSLSVQSSDNSKDISEALSGIKNEIASTAELVENAGTSVKSVIDGIKSIADTFVEISEGLHEISVGNTQVLEALSRLVNISENVNEYSESNRKSYNAITQSLQEIARLAHRNLEEINTVDNSITTIQSTSTHLFELSETNSGNLKILAEEISTFKT